jgi:hypothetical protein
VLAELVAAPLDLDAVAAVVVAVVADLVAAELAPFDLDVLAELVAISLVAAVVAELEPRLVAWRAACAIATAGMISASAAVASPARPSAWTSCTARGVAAAAIRGGDGDLDSGTRPRPRLRLRTLYCSPPLQGVAGDHLGQVGRRSEQTSFCSHECPAKSDNF